MIRPEQGPRQGPSLLDAALEYHRRGWSIIPIAGGTKRPPKRFRWRRFQSNRPTADELQDWFAGRDDLGLAVILGEVSGGLVCRDFDTMESYNAWALAHPDLAATLPTVATARGGHVYFLNTAQKIIKLADGELRGAGYCLLPPSRHPYGPIYTWLVPLPAGPLPRVDDVAAAGFLGCAPSCNREHRDNRGLRRITEAVKGCSVASVLSVARPNGCSSVAIDPDIDQVILETLPTSIGQRNRQVFELARALKAIPRLADAPVDTLGPSVRRWHHHGVVGGVIGTEPFEETWIDFLQAWPKVKFPRGAEPMVAIFERANAGPMPRAAERYEQPTLRLLVALCRELQRESGGRPFYLACRTAGRLLKIDHTTAWRWLFLLAHDRVIDEVEKGLRGGRRASRYRYLGD